MKSPLIHCVLVVCIAAFLVGFAPGNGAIKTDPEVSTLLTNINPNNIFNTAQTLQNFRTRQSCSDVAGPNQGVTPARDYLFARYMAIPGLQVRLDPFPHASCPTSPTYNVIAWLPGRHRDRLVIIGGHYDSRTTNVFDNTSDAPGGNDAGAQTGVVLELARILSSHQFDATIVFMSFSGEEQGLFGSHSIAANLTRYFEEPQVIAMLNTDIPGGDNTANVGADFQHFRLYSPGIPRERLSTDPDGTTDNTSPSRGLMRYIGTWGGAYVPAITMQPLLREDRPGRGSDHTSFISNAYPAVRFMETHECSPSPVDNSCGAATLPCPPPAQIPASCKDTTFITTHQHSPNDLVQYITPPYAATIAQVMASVAASLARAPLAPTEFNAHGNAVKGVRLDFEGPEDSQVDHFVVAARSINENFYRQRVVVAHPGGQLLSPQTLGFNPGDSFYISVASVDSKGHESLFAYPEVRCDSNACAIPSYAFDVTAPLPMPPPPPPDQDADDD